MEPRPPAQQPDVLAYSSPKNVLVILAGRKPSLLIGIEENYRQSRLQEAPCDVQADSCKWEEIMPRGRQQQTNDCGRAI